MNRIKLLRMERGISQRAMAADLFVNQTAVSQWERGATNPSTETALRLAEYFNVSVDYLLGVSDNSDQQKKPTEADVPDELLNSPIKLEALTAFSSLSPEDQQFFLDMMRARGKI